MMRLRSQRSPKASKVKPQKVKDNPQVELLKRLNPQQLQALVKVCLQKTDRS